MSKMGSFLRPEVMFDPTNSEHRRWFAEFMVGSAWGQCPVRFVTEDGSINLIEKIKGKLLLYYATKEFGYEIQRGARRSAA